MMIPSDPSTTSLPAFSWNAGIIADAVGPGLRQLTRIPRGPYSTAAFATHWFMTTLENR